MRHHKRDEVEYDIWTRSPPFVLNPRGLLVHRVRYVVGIKSHSLNLSHFHVGYECGNGCNVDLELIREVLHADPPRDRLLCDFCEFKARGDGQKPADEIAGRHVHRGRLRVFRTCCQHRASN
jgi:hypothetical protein